MKIPLRIMAAIGLAMGVAGAGVQAADEVQVPPNDATTELPEDYSCTFCHGKSGTLAEFEENRHLIVTPEDLADDVHWQIGLRCHDCHGGNPLVEDYVDHRKDPGFWPIGSPADQPAFCGRCHSSIEYMRRYRPSPRIDQESEYWTSGHGQRLKQVAEAHQQELEKVPPGEEPPPMEAVQVATCLNCHSKQKKHHIYAVDDPHGPVYPTHVATTCAECHSDPEMMAGRSYHGRPLGHDQYEKWVKSVHGEAMLKRGDLSAPTCNDCHGNHGALPPEIDSVANACGMCHTKVASLFAETLMKHRFEESGLPGCAACHGNHEILSPSDAMLGMEGGAVCIKCHENEQHGATLGGAQVAQTLRGNLENLKQQIDKAEQLVTEAEHLGMEVRGPRFDLRQAHDALTNARAQIHTFSLERVDEALAEGLGVTTDVQASAAAALAEHTNRRIWLAASLVPMFIVIVLLLLYIRTLPQGTA